MEYFDNRYSAPPELEAPAEASRPYAILLDDDLDVAQMYRYALEHHGFRVSLMAEAEELFAAVATEVPDILVLDWQLRGTTGADVLEALRRDWRTAGVPVFMLSNFGGDLNGAVDRVFKAGALAWLTKSDTTPDRLAKCLREGLRR